MRETWIVLLVINICLFLWQLALLTKPYGGSWELIVVMLLTITLIATSVVMLARGND